MSFHVNLGEGTRLVRDGVGPWLVLAHCKGWELRMNPPAAQAWAWGWDKACPEGSLATSHDAHTMPSTKTEADNARMPQTGRLTDESVLGTRPLSGFTFFGF